MSTLFNILDGIVDSGEENDILSNPNAVIDYAESMNIAIDAELAGSIIRVGSHWASERESGSGEWGRMRGEAEQQLTAYIHEQSGDVATREMWESDFRSMDVESWFGKDAEECAGLHCMDDAPWLIEVEQNDVGEWVDA